MSESDEFSGPVVFEARFPPDSRFAATAGELAARLAAACGCAPHATEEVRGDVSRAFGEALGSAGGAGLDLTLRADRGAFEAELACDGRALLHCSKTPSA
jgi:hypothetical protein